VVNTSSNSVMKMLARQKRRRHEDVRPATGRFDTLGEACREILHSSTCEFAYRDHRRLLSAENECCIECGPDFNGVRVGPQWRAGSNSSIGLPSGSSI